MVATRSAQRTLLIVAIAIAVATLVGCDFTRSQSPYPPFFPYVIDEVDLSGALPSAIRDLRMEATAFPGSGARYFSIVAKPDSAADDVAILLNDGFSIVFIETSAGVLEFDTTLFTNHFDGVQLGSLNYVPASGVVSNVIRREDVYNSIVYHPSDYVIFQADSGTDITMQRWDTAWVASGAGDTFTPAFSDGRSLRDVRATYRYNGGSLPSDLSVFIKDEFGRTYRRVVQWESLDIGVPGFASWIDLTASTAVAYPELDLETLQDTPEGILSADTDSDDLIRVNATSGGISDRFSPGENPRNGDRYPVVFDPAGEFYLLLDTELRVLYKVAPWW